MESIKICQWVGQDGVLHLDILIGMTEQDVEVMVIYQSVPSLTRSKRSLKQLYGVCSDDPIFLDDQGILERFDND